MTHFGQIGLSYLFVTQFYSPNTQLYPIWAQLDSIKLTCGPFGLISTLIILSCGPQFVNNFGSFWPFLARFGPFSPVGLTLCLILVYLSFA